MMRKHFKKIVILSLFLLLVSGFGIKHAVGKGKKKIKAKICMTVTGDIIGGVLYESGGFFIEAACQSQGIMHNTTQLVVKPTDLDLTYFQYETFKTPGAGAVCFSEGIYYDIPLVVVEEDDGTAWARTHFYAFTNDGTSEMNYQLDMFGTFDDDPDLPSEGDGVWPPQRNGTTWVHLDSWELFTWGRGKLRKISCTGSGTFFNGVTIKVTRTD